MLGEDRTLCQHAIAVGKKKWRKSGAERVILQSEEMQGALLCKKQHHTESGILGNAAQSVWKKGGIQYKNG